MPPISPASTRVATWWEKNAQLALTAPFVAGFAWWLVSRGGSSGSTSAEVDLRKGPTAEADAARPREPATVRALKKAGALPEPPGGGAR